MATPAIETRPENAVGSDTEVNPMGPENIHSMNSTAISFDEIPIVDVAPLIDGSDPRKVAEQLADIYANIGFLYIENHGVSERLIQDMYRLTREFFALPMEDKQRVNIERSGPTLRGYIPMYWENVDPTKTKDFKECFDYGADGDAPAPFFGPNLMPEQPAGFGHTAMTYHAAMVRLAVKMVEGIALSLGLPADYFAERQRNPITVQRLLHYPPQSGQISVDELGIGAHTDYGFLTILHQDDNGGLQVMNRVGEWVNAPPVPGTFVVNIGDLVETLTNGRYVSTFHRVINVSGQERYSLPFFIDMDFDAQVEPVPTCLEPVGDKVYPAYICGQHKYRRYVDSYAHLAV
ncbi:MAG: isopenicillin N synthase family dioxygenase [Gammaproteobacteria bacterium]